MVLIMRLSYKWGGHKVGFHCITYHQVEPSLSEHPLFSQPVTRCKNMY